MSKNFLTLQQTTDKVAVLQTITQCPVSHQQLYGDYNLGLHVADDPKHVLQNRMDLLAQIQTKYPNIQRIQWLNQIHGAKVHTTHPQLSLDLPNADAQISHQTDTALAIMTADCVPIMLSLNQGAVIGAIHAGWQGLAKGVIQNTIQTMLQNHHDQPYWQAWIGACIAQNHYEINENVKQQMIAQMSLKSNKIHEFFLPIAEKQGHYLANLPAIADYQLQQMGVQQIYQSGLDSFSDERFYSYRKQTKQNQPFTGRMAMLIFKK